MGEILFLYDKAAISLMTLLLRMGKFDQYDKLIANFPRNLSDKLLLKQATLDLFEHCRKLIKLIEKLQKVFVDYHRCKAITTQLI